MSKESFIELCDMLRDELEPEPQFLMPREPISVEKQVAVALYKLASTAEYRVIGNAMGIHKSSVKKCLYRVIKAINKVMLQNYINMPNENEANLIASNFENKRFIPQIIGSIDGTHIEIIPPKEGYRDFINRKGWPSYNVLAIVDHNGRFRNIVIKHPGSYHDTAVLKENVQKTRNINRMEIPFIIVGDPAYPLLPWFIKGFSGSLSSEEESFNVHLNSARISIEMAFAFSLPNAISIDIRAEFKWTLKDSSSDDNPEIIAACCVLHNFVEKNKDRFYIQWLQEIEQLELVISQPRTATITSTDSIDGTNIRNHLKQYLSDNFPLRKALIRP
ncbi:protein ALP1-like [Solenopsis invicta]|uniref:protein ALP1-like n=1 Tax=Solenopsis invicta TaxID=13686 RepID=UPI00193EACA5|nr:protein ALP1-like [Solenopsis invicta]